MSAFDERMQQLRKRYAGRAAEDGEALASARASEEWAEVRRIAHGLAGTGAVFGFPKVSATAEQLEEGVDRELPVAELHKLADALAACLSEAAQER